MVWQGSNKEMKKIGNKIWYLISIFVSRKLFFPPSSIRLFICLFFLQKSSLLFFVCVRFFKTKKIVLIIFHKIHGQLIFVSSHWNNELIRASKSKSKPSLLRAIIKMFGPRMMFYGLVLATVEIVLRYVIFSFIKSIYNNFTITYLNVLITWVLDPIFSCWSFFYRFKYSS